MSTKWTLCGLIAMALLARLVVYALCYQEPKDNGLTRQYIRGGISIAQGQGLTRTTTGGGEIPDVLHPAGYPVLISIVYVAGGPSLILPIMHSVQIVLDSLVCLLLFLCGRNFFGRGVGVIAAGIYAVLPQAIVACMPILPDAMACFFLALALCCFSFVYARSARWAVPTGLALGLACHFRAEFLALPLLFSVVLVLVTSLRTACRWIPAMWLAFAIVLMPWMIWTYKATGTMLIGTTSPGGSMYESLGERSDNPWGIVCNDGWLDGDAIRRGLESPWDVDGNRLYRRLAFECIRSDLPYYVKLVVGHRLPKAILGLAMGRGYLNIDVPEDYVALCAEGRLNGVGRLLKHPVMTLSASWENVLQRLITVAFLGSLGVLFVLYSGKRVIVVLLAGIWAYFVTSISLLKLVEARNIIPVIVPLTMSFAACCAWWWNKRVAGGGREKAADES